MDCNDYHVDYNIFDIIYCGHPNPPYANIQFKQSTNLIFSHFQVEYHPFIHDTLKQNNFVSLYILFYRRKKNASRTDITNDDQKSYACVLTYGD